METRVRPGKTLAREPVLLTGYREFSEAADQAGAPDQAGVQAVDQEWAPGAARAAAETGRPARFLNGIPARDHLSGPGLSIFPDTAVRVKVTGPAPQ